MTESGDKFSTWLNKKLKVLNTDESVYGSYITGLLNGDETLEEKTEAIESILAGILESDMTAFCQEIIDMWQKCHSDVKEPCPVSILEDMGPKLVRFLEPKPLSATVHREYTQEERKIRDSILAQYSEVIDDENDTDEVCKEKEVRGNILEPNTNVLSVQEAEKEKREKAKIESQKKKDKDKEDREKQKQMKEEKQEKRKTQKGERKR